MLPIEIISPLPPRVFSNKSFFYVDTHGELMAVCIRFYNCFNEPKRFLTVDFYKHGMPIQIPLGMTIATNVEVGDNTLLYPQFGALQFSFVLDYGFALCYMGYVLLIAKPGIDSVEEIVDCHYKTFPPM